jgi:hypothetical protein
MKKLSSVALILLALISTVVAVIYFTKTAGNLPHFFIGYAKGSAHKHTKHALAFISLAVILLIGAWMVSGPVKQGQPANKLAEKETEN